MGSAPSCAQYYDLFGPELFVVVAWRVCEDGALYALARVGRECDFTRSARRLLRGSLSPTHQKNTTPQGTLIFILIVISIASFNPGHSACLFYVVLVQKWIGKRGKKNCAPVPGAHEN